MTPYLSSFILVLLTSFCLGKELDETIEEQKEVLENRIEEAKNEVNKAIENLNATVEQKKKEVGERKDAIVATVGGTELCSASECNNRGTCLGTKKSFICGCQLGFSGRTCEDMVCDSTRDCNGRGLCIGTTSQLTCLCNLGFTGKRCETPI
ncbi:hypothetical protein WR25_10190 isoform C [Diploscapter pachys]|uniref:EGF-like domain-containing protein n=1 Tax=Diploscapter pachys TaxID=2018661 RepID=A0A2A2KM53_9BILA|nr:hypothetical protein WR25_10190 isoform A [Diploscapter pachys]PAV74984.1 hypothetical protein WR25_10190 isoform C [Diploscapter pachys]